MPLPNPTTLASHFYYVWMGENCGKEKENLTKKKKKKTRKMPQFHIWLAFGGGRKDW
jgi:hypothetical protein